MGKEDGQGGWSFTIPVLPPSVNALHNIIYSQRKVVLKPEILKWRSDMANFIPRINHSAGSFFRVDCKFFYNHYFQNGNLRRFDTHNMVKVLLDVIAWKAGFDDSRVKEGSWQSVNDRNERVEVIIREYVLTASTPEPDSLRLGDIPTVPGVIIDN